MIANAFGLMIVVSVLQLLIGLGLLFRFRFQAPRMQVLGLGMLAGMAAHTLLVFMLSALRIPITLPTVLLVAAVGAVASNLRVANIGASYRSLLKRSGERFQMVDILVLAVAVYFLFISGYATFFWPVTPFDAMAGIDLVARTAVTEKTLDCSIYTTPILQGHLSNQPFYAPFAMIMQVIYRLLGFPFGQMWLTLMTVASLTVLWSMLRERLHPALAGVLWLLFISIPEQFGYTLLLQTDLANATFYCLGGILMVQALQRNDMSRWYVSAIFLAAACWSRTETIILVGAMTAAMLPFVFSRLEGASRWRAPLVTVAASAVAFALWHVLWFYAYLPVRPDTARELMMFTPDRFGSMFNDLVLDVMMDTGYWAYSFILFGIIFVANAIVHRTVQPVQYLIWIAVTLLVLLVIGTIFASAVADQTLRRALFKLFPFVWMFMAETALLRSMSARIRAWELGG